MKVNQLTICLGTSQHTYGDAVKGVVLLDSTETLFINVLEMAFTGTCGATFVANIRLDSAQRVSEEKTLFSHRQTLISAREAQPGLHRFAFEFRFPHQDEVLLSPNTVPFDSQDRFHFKYQLSANVSVVTEDGSTITLDAEAKSPKFSGSRPVGWPVRPKDLNIETILKSKWSKTSIVKRKTEAATKASTIASFRIDDSIITGDLIPLNIAVNTPAVGEEGASSPNVCVGVKLESLSISLKSRVKLTAQGQYKHLELDSNLPLRVASFHASKRCPAPIIRAGQSTNVAQHLDLRCPVFLRPTFQNELITFDYVLSIRAELDVGGKLFTAKLDSIPVKVVPHALSSEVDCFDYASNPPSVLPALDDDELYSPPESAPSTPPPEWTPFPDDEIERRFRQNSGDPSSSRSDADYFALFPCQ